ncbi:MAG: CHASE domain-containing protein [Gammaproteobacteria bacterium]
MPIDALQRFRASSVVGPLVVLAVGTLATVLATLYVAHSTRVQDEERFAHIVSRTQDSIVNRLDTYIAMMRAGAGLIASHDGVVDREQFRLFAEQLRLPINYPGVQGIGYSVRLPGRETAAAQQALVEYGVFDLRVHPEGTRDEIHAIVHLEPLDRRNRAALGFDMFSEPVRRAAMERARDTGLPSASGPVQLVQEIDEAKQAGFLIYVPVYRGGTVPATVKERRERLLGFVYCPFRADDLMRGILGTWPRPRVALEIYDGKPAPENLLHRTQLTRFTPPRFVTENVVEVAGRPWTIRYFTRPAFESSSASKFVIYVLLGGALATLLLAAVTASEARAKRQADRVAKALRENARKLEVLHRTAARLSAELDPDRLIQDVTDAGRELVGAEIGAFFYNVTEENGEERYQLSALSGVAQEAFAGLPMPRKTQVFEVAFRGEGPVRSDDITTDPRFRRNESSSGLPCGHWPVRSYLAAPVISRSGEVIGALFFGHSQPGMFSIETERSIMALAGHAAIAIDNARLFKASQEEIAARKQVEAQQKLLLDELNHRVKNTLATVQSIAAHTLRSAPDPHAFRRAFEARLIALSEAHNLLSRSNWRGAELRELLYRELSPHGVEDASRIVLEGEPVWLPPASAVAIGMAVHELATNAARHGSLSSPHGHLSVRWTVTPDDTGMTLRLVWEESGGPPVQEPSRRGFGTRLIERGLKHDLQGEAKLYFHRSGVKCVIEAHLCPHLAAA